MTASQNDNGPGGRTAMPNILDLPIVLTPVPEPPHQFTRLVDETQPLSAWEHVELYSIIMACWMHVCERTYGPSPLDPPPTLPLSQSSPPGPDKIKELRDRQLEEIVGDLTKLTSSVFRLMKEDVEDESADVKFQRDGKTREIRRAMRVMWPGVKKMHGDVQRFRDTAGRVVDGD